jgi:tetratricopeptide (TPR) repeat protein
MTKSILSFVLVLLVLPLFSGIYAQSRTVFPSLEADPKAVEYGRRLGSGYTWEDLAEISLWASGGDPAASAGRGKPSYLELIKNAALELINDPGLPADERERGDFILAFMFKKFLKNYSEKQTRVDTVLANGSYNCVSSAALYGVLAMAAGLEARGVVTRDHAFITILTKSGAVDVETTNPYGFDPGNRKDFHDGFGQVTGFVYVPARNYRDRADIGLPELISLIFNNRITELETRRRFAEAVPLAINRAALLEHSGNAEYSEFSIDPRKMAMDRIFNYGSSLLGAGRESEALAWVDLAEPRFPDTMRWQEFTNAAVNNLMVKLVQAQRFAEARSLLNARASRLGPENYEKLDAMLSDTELGAAVTAIKTIRDADAVLAALDNAGIQAARIKEMRIYALLKKAEFLAKEQGWQAAISFTETAEADYGPDPRFNEHLRVFRTNRVADLHNAFADAYNKKDIEKARTIIAGALEEFPGNRQLLSDKQLMEDK